MIGTHAFPETQSGEVRSVTGWEFQTSLPYESARLHLEGMLSVYESRLPNGQGDEREREM